MGAAVPSHLPEFDLRHAICSDAYWAMVKASEDPETVERFLDSRPHRAGQLSRARAWSELEPRSRIEFEAWLIEILRARESCSELAA